MRTGKHTILRIVMVICITFCCVGCQKKETADLQEIEIKDTQDEDRKAEEDLPQEEVSLCVYVCGAVNQPGVYSLPETGRVYEALAMAGGMTENAAADYLNQAQLVTDGQRLYVPTNEELESGQTAMDGVNAPMEGGNAPQAAENRLVNLNQASMEELMTLTGIGEVKAAGIVSYREEHGGFAQIEDVMQVEGIKESTFQKIKDQITV
ncbi:helix-hairpin-helix domain-containing protein [Hespellia stercorisuis]|uniref:Competence protein ComEA n=1 Tax=Hespellia stercorisuis DSM 15480 TaxID=1121950 RepID=A0A1M6MPF7_9FIRM|nr:helix-hairpin-helix domain-containing protein [Hespellia stercorisuis]SHJ85395.1 competence protein ComEA [Hespellia stercorisuis DSM 15480]